MTPGFTVHLANTAAIQQYSGLKYADDNSDTLVSGDAASGDITHGLYLPEITTYGVELYVQTDAACATANSQHTRYPGTL